MLDGARLLLWPSHIQWRSETGPDYRDAAVELARTLDCWIIQSNWATSVNDPTLRRLGGSLTITPSGDILGRAPFDEPHADIVEVTDP